MIVGLGGTTKPGSFTERALRGALEAARTLGAETQIFDGPFLARLPIYDPGTAERTEEQVLLVEAVRKADGLILATPAYHAGISGMIKNAIDLFEDLRTDCRPYLDRRAVGCIITAMGWQGGGTTLTSLRTVVHALRGWPTPMGLTLNAGEPVFDDKGRCQDQRIAEQLGVLAGQVMEFARRFR